MVISITLELISLEFLGKSSSIIIIINSMDEYTVNNCAGSLTVQRWSRRLAQALVKLEASSQEDGRLARTEKVKIHPYIHLMIENYCDLYCR